MKRSIPLLAVLLACLVFVPAVLAQPGSPGGPGPGHPSPGQPSPGQPGPNCPSVNVSVFAVSGSVTAVDTSADALTVTVDHGTRCHGGTITVNVTSDTKIFLLRDHLRTDMTLADINVGDQVAIIGTVDNSSDTPVYTARVVCVRVPSFDCEGSVTAVDSGGGTLAVAVGHGSDGLDGTITVNVTSDTKLFAISGGQKTAITLADIVVGEHVSVHGTVDESSDTPVYTASLICVHGLGLSFACVGSVTATDTSADALTVAVDHGTAQLGDTLTANITGDTALFLLGAHQKTAITLADINVGDQVAMVGTVDSSSDPAVYTATIVLDWGTAATLPLPICTPAALKVKAGQAGRGDTLKIHVKIADKMPGAGSAKVALTLTTLKGKKLASTTVSGVSLNKAAKLSWRLPKRLAKGTYRIVAKATDWAGNKQAKPATATLKVT